MKVPIRIALPVLLLLFYVGGFYLNLNHGCGVDTKYNAVFYGILKKSNNPEMDLAILGLSADLAVEAGKHAYLPKNEYVKYVPWSELTTKEFHQKITNRKLFKFYLLHPNRLLQGMEYTASQSFNTGGFLGKYEKKDFNESTYTLGRFTLWSDIRNGILPKKLIFILLFFSSFFTVSIWEYIKAKKKRTSRLKIELLWVVTAIGLLQFPMPYVGNGEADTAKQLFLFNFIFDLLIVIAIIWAFEKLKKLKYYFLPISRY